MWSPLWSILVCKIPQFWAKLPIRTAHHTFLEIRHAGLLKIHIMFCPLRGAKKGISSWTNTSVQRCLLYHYFKINPPIFCCPLFSENYLNPQVRVRISIIVNWTPKRLISPVLNLLLNLYIPPWLWKSFKFIVLRLLKIHL